MIMGSNQISPRPLLGIGIPTYNRAACLSKSLNGMLEQSLMYRNDVLVAVCDNSSTDSTANVIQMAKERYDQLCVVRNSVNIGGVANILRVIEVVDAEWVWVFPDDCLPEPGVIEKLVAVLNDARPPIVYLRCSQWSEASKGIYNVKKSDVLGSKGEICQHLSWLPCLLIHRKSVLCHFPAAYRLGCFSYPHLVLALSALSLVEDDRAILAVPAAFKTQPDVYITKRYSWIHGSLLQYANTVSSCLTSSQTRRVLRWSAKREKMAVEALRAVVSEYQVVPPRTPWFILYYYGIGMLPMLLIYIWLRYIPNRVTLLLVKISASVFRIARLGATSVAMDRLHARLSSREAKLTANF